MELCKDMIALLKSTCDLLTGSKKRQFMAKTVNALGNGGQSKAEKLLGWCRSTIRKGQHEIRSNITCIDNFKGRGRKPIEEHFPGFIDKIHEIVDEKTQADPALKTDKLYLKITVKEIRNRLIASGYTDAELPAKSTLGRKLNQLGYNLKRVQKVNPEKKYLRQMPSLINLK
jgi:hypothetical protein